MAGTGGLSPTAAGLAATVAARLPDDPILVALSGGADSASLAWAVVECGANARAVSIDHGLPASADLIGAAVKIASQLGLEHTVVAVASESASETDLRAARLEALESMRRPGEWIATGHTRDDLAETVLGNVLRGSGTSGLAGIPERRARFVRPLLTAGRSDTRAVASELGLSFVDDPQNDDLSIRRNSLRNRTIPSLAAEYNPNLVAGLARLAVAAADDDSVLQARADAVPVRRRGGSVLLPAASLQTLPAPIAVRVARNALRLAGDGSSGDAGEIVAVLDAAAGARTTIRGGLDVIREGPWVVLATGEETPPEPVLLETGREVDWGDWRIRLGGSGGIGRFRTEVDAAAGLVVRASRPGDRIALRDGSKSVAAALAEAGVPARLRPCWPVLDSSGTIAWIVGARAAPATGSSDRVSVRAVRRQL